MGKWLEAYRSGRWRDDLGTTRHSMEPGRWMEWQSLASGSCVGQIVMTSSGGVGAGCRGEGPPRPGLDSCKRDARIKTIELRSRS